MASDGVMYCIGCGKPLRPSKAAQFPLGYRNPYGGKVFGRYRMVGWIGEGFTSEVFDAIEVASERRVALRVVHKHIARIPSFRARFLDGTQRLLGLDHPNTVELRDAGVFEGMLYAVSDFVTAPSAASLRAGLPWSRVRTILMQLCDALSVLHGRGLAHRRLMPSKLYLDTAPARPRVDEAAGPYRCAPEVGDLARLDLAANATAYNPREEFDRQVGERIAAVGTTAPFDYLAPEQLTGKELDHRSDMYALGVIGYEMLVGQRPFADAASPSSLVMAQLKRVPSPPSQHADAPSSADEVILRCLHRDRRERYDDVMMLRAALGAA